MTTIKQLRDGRTLATDGSKLYVNGQDVGTAQVRPLKGRTDGIVGYAQTSAGNIGLSRDDVSVINRAGLGDLAESPEHKAHRQDVARKYHAWNREHNEGGAGYNPYADEYRSLQLVRRHEPTHKSDL